ncbi:MAG: DUF2892 domain-containing protein [Deltaproteobacteria bacterium]|nr:DUF2892 domain-containing protein [Deltaproteobacteria bacterium]
MKTNMGAIDRGIRLIFAVAVSVLVFTGILQGTLAIGLGALAVIMLATAAIGWCPLYLPLHISTRKPLENESANLPAKS